jgi:hypothetical protein
MAMFNAERGVLSLRANHRCSRLLQYSLADSGVTRLIQIWKVITSVHSASLFPLMALNIWKVTPEGAAIRLVRSILADSPSPLTIKEIYDEAVRREAGQKYPHPPTAIPGGLAQEPVKKRGIVRKSPPAPPHPDKAVRSMRCVPHAHMTLVFLQLTFRGSAPPL